MFKLILLTAVIAIVSAGRLTRNVEPPSTNEALVEAGLNIAKEGVKKLEEIASNLISANSTDALLEKGADIWDQVKNLANTITKNTQEWSENSAVQDLRNLASSTVNDLKTEHPGLSTAVVESVDSLNKVANDIILKLKLLVDDKDVKAISNTLIESASSGINTIKEQLKDTLPKDEVKVA
ncbi:uncharacterized protein ACRADG_011185 [Cochliomyia hominivorax]